MYSEKLKKYYEKPEAIKIIIIIMNGLIKFKIYNIKFFIMVCHRVNFHLQPYHNILRDIFHNQLVYINSI